MGTGARLALFDLDGTLTRRDTFTPWVSGLLLRQPLRWWRVPALLLPLIGYALRFHDRGRLKGAVLHILFAGLDRATIESWSARFVHRTVAQGMFREALAALRAHRLAGDEVILLSASPDLYVPLIGRELGANHTICTEVRWNGDRLDGRLAGANRRGPEKARVLAQLRAARPGTPVIGYGNSPADLDHLQHCEEGVYVNAPPSLVRRTPLPALRWVRWR